MTATENPDEASTTQILTAEQEAILDKYVQHLDQVLENLKESDRFQVEIETLHLKKILHP